MSEHPTHASGGWRLRHVILDAGPGQIVVALMKSQEHQMLALRWRKGNEQVDSWAGGETEWFVVPFTFAAAIGRSLIELRASGLDGFNEDGYAAMVEWLDDNEGIASAICY